MNFAPDDPRGRSNAWLSCITIDGGTTRLSPEEMRLHLEGYNIESRRLWKPMHAQVLYANHPSRLDGTADALFAAGLCLPSGTGMTDHDQDCVIEATLEFLHGNGISSAS